MKPVLVLLAAAAVMPNLSQLKEMNARFAPVKPKFDESSLSPGDRKALAKLIEAGRVLNFIFMDQLWRATARSTPSCRPTRRRSARNARATSG